MKSTVKAQYEEAYGLAEKVILRSIGGDPNAVIEDYCKTKVEADDLLGTLMPNTGAFAPKSDADNVHFAIIKEIKKIYFSNLSREAALVICNSLPDQAKITLFAGLKDLSLSVTDFANEWNKTNPDSEAIRYNSDFAI